MVEFDIIATMDRENKKSLPAEINQVKFLPLGGIEDVTRNLYVYEYLDEILLVDCGIGFADETMLGVDLMLPDISYLLQTPKKIVGLLLSHGHEDHIGAVPFVLPELFKKKGAFPVFASRLTAALTNEKLKEFGIDTQVEIMNLEEDNTKQLGNFTFRFVRITHSVPDSSHILIKTPIGNFYHGADFKFDLTPADGKTSDYQSIAKFGSEGILAVMSDCLGSEHEGFSYSEEMLAGNISNAMEQCSGKFFLTTYSSNISRINQTIAAAEKHGRKICFVGRSLIKVKEVGKKLNLLQIKNDTEIKIDEMKNYSDKDIAFIVAGSQGQENSALTRIAENEHKDIRITPGDMVVFSSDTIPGNEISVNSLIDTLSKRGAKVIYSDLTHDYHVSGHGFSKDHMLLLALTKPKFAIPISGTYRHMISYRTNALKMNYKNSQILLIENGQELLFTKDKVMRGKKIKIKNVYVDQISGEEVESFILRDREMLAHDGIVVIMVEVNASDGQLGESFGIVTRGLVGIDIQKLEKGLQRVIKERLSQKTDKVGNWVHLRRFIESQAVRYIDHKLKKKPLVMSVVIEI